MTVDGGVWEGSDGSASSGTWNQSQVWSNGLSTTGGSVENPTQAFNGDTADVASGAPKQSPTASTEILSLCQQD